MFLVAYSPELNSIEEAFSKVKRILRKVEAPRPGSFGGGHRPGASGIEAGLPIVSNKNHLWSHMGIGETASYPTLGFNLIRKNR